MRGGPDDNDAQAGRLVLMHGVPGTGKTYGIAALGLAWKSWARFSYIVDPDEFLGKAEYMMSVLMDGDPDLWRVIVMEDVDEFLTMDAKERSGQALGRLLNLTEGFVGNGLKVLVLMTTNESMKDVHPAVARPGRCLQEIEFTEMSVAESAAWISRVPHLSMNPQTLIREAYTLAELYSIAAGRPVRARKDAVGIR